MNNPLVSVGIVTFNAATYIEETLDSVYNQTYNNIELIVSDDHSQDGTTEVIKLWLEKYSSRFQNVILLESEINTGVSKNSNRAFKSSSGEWYKMLDGDDVLFPNCIQDFINYISQNPECKIIASGTNVYEETINDSSCLRQNVGYDKNFYGCDTSAQLQYIIRSNIIFSSSVIIKRETLCEIGGFDERYMVEDFPLFLTALEKGVHIYFMEKLTTGYRVHSSFSNKSGQLFNIKYKRIAYNFRKERCYKYLSFKEKLGSKLRMKLYNCYENWGFNDKKYERSFVFLQKLINKLVK